MKPKVLIVDDDQNAINLYTRALEAAGFEVAANSQAIGTTNKVKEFKPDVILMDVMMPALSGTRMVELLKQNSPTQAAIILVSNKSEEELKKIMKECGANDYFPKLNGPAALVAKVKKHVKVGKAEKPKG